MVLLMITLTYGQKKLLINNPVSNKIIFYKKDTFILTDYRSIINANKKFVKLHYLTKENLRLDSVDKMRSKALFYSLKANKEYVKKCKDASIIINNSEDKYNIIYAENQWLNEQLKIKKNVILYGGIGSAILIVGILSFK